MRKLSRTPKARVAFSPIPTSVPVSFMRAERGVSWTRFPCHGSLDLGKSVEFGTPTNVAAWHARNRFLATTLSLFCTLRKRCIWCTKYVLNSRDPNNKLRYGRSRPNFAKTVHMIFRLEFCLLWETADWNELEYWGYSRGILYQTKSKRHRRPPPKNKTQI